MVRGYKAFNADMTCRGFQYEVGKTYEMDSCELCDHGFHFCKNIADCFTYYFSDDDRFAEVEAYGDIEEAKDDSKCVTNKIRIVKEIPRQEAVDMSNTGDWNTGDWNTGDWNTGDWNTGDWNTTRFSTGCFCTEEKPILMFDEPSNMTYLEWRNSTAAKILRNMPQKIDDVDWICTKDMTDEEKEAHPEHETTGGYLKVTRREADKQAWWEGLREEDKETIKAIPNFNAEKFYKCTGVRVEG